jgi:hypothetical protein
MPKVSDRRRSRRRRDGQSRRRDDEVHHAAARLVASGLKVEQLRRVRDARDSLTRALRLPYTPSEWRDADCVAVIRHLRGDWKHIQAHFQGDPEAMKVIVDYRKRYIDGLINELAADKVKYPGLIARASGSTDLTSDYDVTLATADITADPDFTALDDAARLAAARGARDADARAAAELGRRIKETFGKQSATVFDTNFYLCDFLGSFTNNIVTGRPNAVAVARTSPASAAYQDVLALMKVRRYMRADEWRRYTRVAFPGTAHDRFDTADEIYRANVGALVKAVVATLALGDDEPVLAGLATDDDRLHALDSYRPDRVRAISDELCRAAEESLRRLQAELVERPAPERPEDERSEDEIRADIERATGQAAFFASEAYHTEGALLQIVVQRADLRPQHYLDSLNEQFGDFIKDVRHYTGERDRDDDPHEAPDERARRRELADGVMYFRGAKYMSRLLQAIDRLEAADARIHPQLLLPDLRPVDVAALRAGIEAQLVPLRRNPDRRSLEDRAVAAQLAVRQLFPDVHSPEDLKALVTRWVAKVNVAARDVG